MDITVHASTHFWNVNFSDVSQLIKQNKITCNLKEGSNINEDLFDPPQLLPFKCWAELYLMAATMGFPGSQSSQPPSDHTQHPACESLDSSSLPRKYEVWGGDTMSMSNLGYIITSPSLMHIVKQETQEAGEGGRQKGGSYPVEPLAGLGAVVQAER